MPLPDSFWNDTSQDDQDAFSAVFGVPVRLSIKIMEKAL